MQIRIFLIALGLAFGLVTFEVVRRKLVRPEYALLWMAMSLVTMLIGLFPDVLVLVRRVTGMEYQSTVIIMVFFFVVCMFMNFSIIVSRQSGRIIQLTQEVALLRNRLDDVASTSASGAAAETQHRADEAE